MTTGDRYPRGRGTFKVETLPPGARRCTSCGDLFTEMDGTAPAACLDCRREAVSVTKGEYTRDLLEARGRALREVIDFAERQLCVVTAALATLPPEPPATKGSGE